MRELAANPGQTNTAAHRDLQWVFRGGMPGGYLDPMHLRQEARPLFSSLAARLGTLTELSRQAPAAILAEARLDCNPETLEKPRHRLRRRLRPLRRRPPERLVLHPDSARGDMRLRPTCSLDA